MTAGRAPKAYLTLKTLFLAEMVRLWLAATHCKRGSQFGVVAICFSANKPLAAQVWRLALRFEQSASDQLRRLRGTTVN